MSETEIKALLSTAFAQTETRDFSGAIQTLEKGHNNHPENKKILRALSIVHQKNGAFEQAIKALDLIIEKDKTDIDIWAMKGAFHEKIGAFREALQAYHCVLDLNQNNPMPDQSKVAHIQKRIPLILTNIEDRINQEIGSAGIEITGEDSRFSDALDIMFGRKTVFLQEPQHLYFPELPQKQFYDKSVFSWSQSLEARWKDIQKELLEVLSDDQFFSPYLQSEDHIPNSAATPLANSMDWSSLYLIKDGNAVPENQAMLPATMAALKSVDLCRTGGGTPSVLFSRLKPGTHIPPHSGMLNMRLICHLPIIVPGDCRIRVGNKFHEWEEGKLVIFDDTIEHEAWNDSDKDRFVLLFDVWRPEITSRERQLLDILISAR